MSAHSRVGYFGVAIALFLLVCGVLTSRSITAGFDQMDTQNLLREVGWVVADLEASAISLAEFANEIGTMPETQSFLSGMEPNYLSENFSPMSAEIIEFDLVAFYSAEGGYVAGVRYDARYSEGTTLSESPSQILARRIARHKLEPGRSSIGLVQMDGTVYLLAIHLVHGLDDLDLSSAGIVVVGRRFPKQYMEYEGSLGATYALVAPRELSSWKGEGERLDREEVYLLGMDLSDSEVIEDGEDIEWDLEPEVPGDDWQVIEFDVDLEVFEKTQYFRLDTPMRGMDGVNKTQVMCSLGGDWASSEMVVRVLVSQRISQLAQGKARLVTLALWVAVGLIIGFTFFAIREINLRLRTEGSLKTANRELAEVNSQKDRLFSIIGHDMRAPLNGMIRLSELMSRAPDSFAPQDVARFAGNINLTGKQLHGLLENLLNWARVQTGQMSFNPEVLDLAAVIRQVVTLYRPRAEERGVGIDVDIADGMTIFADAEMLKTVMRNLLSNAIKFTDAGGEVSLSGSELDGSVRLSVSDTGQGMSADEVGQLFELASRTMDRNRPEGENGSGFGLLLCQEMVRRHGAELEVYSEIGLGTEFSFSLPSTGTLNPTAANA